MIILENLYRLYEERFASKPSVIIQNHLIMLLVNKGQVLDDQRRQVFTCYKCSKFTVKITH